MDSRLYKEILNFIRSYKGSSRYCLKTLKEMYPNISPYTIGSICSLHYQYKMMANHSKIKDNAELLYDKFQQCVSNGEAPGIIARMAIDLDVCPSALARLILMCHYHDSEEIDKMKTNKTLISQMLKDTTLIEDRDLAFEVYLSIINDDQGGPISDSIRNCIGREYEIVLKKKLQDLGLTFRDERNLRARGYDKTPDIKLETPIAVDGFIVNWIESKALFADLKTHNQYLKNQYLSYWNRFGPGLVIYWFGYLDIVINPQQKKFIIHDSFPDNITMMNPSLIPVPSLS